MRISLTHINIAWQDVDTALLDMDDMLFDFVSDSYFRQKLAPETWDVKNGVTPQEAMEYMRQQYHDVRHTLNWYCLDYWSKQLGLDICVMTTEMGPRIILHEDTIPFFEALKAGGKQWILLTNVYPHNPAVKFEHAGLGAHLDLLPSIHTFGYPKEDQQLWRVVAETTDFKVERTLSVDDSGAILDAVMQSGTRYCLSMTNSDSGIAEGQYQRHPPLDGYYRLIPSLMRRGCHERKTYC